MFKSKTLSGILRLISKSKDIPNDIREIHDIRDWLNVCADRIDELDNFTQVKYDPDRTEEFASIESGNWKEK